MPSQPTANTVDTLLLEDQEIAVRIEPAQGGRIASLRCRRSGLEFLTQAHRPISFASPDIHRAFSEGSCAGIEECLPTVGSCEGSFDHGDFWQLRWIVTESLQPSSISLHADGFSLPLRFHKTLHLFDRRLQVVYRVENIGAHPTSFLYACHPLFAAQPGDRILLAPEVTACRLDYSRNGRCGKPGDPIAWPYPAAPSGVDLSTAQPATSHTAEMLYTDRLQKGVCGIYRTQKQQGLTLRFNTAQLPYLGLWLCYGGWPDLAGHSQQQAVALEPTNAPCNTLVSAQEKGLATNLVPGESFRWTLSFHVSEPGLSVEQFTALFSS